MKTKKIILIIALLIILSVFLTGCIPGDPRYDAANPAGFWWGLWHGFVVWISFFIGLFTGGQFTIFESYNTGWPYNLGFLLGASSSITGVSTGGIRIGKIRIGSRD